MCVDGGSRDHVNKIAGPRWASLAIDRMSEATVTDDIDPEKFATGLKVMRYSGACVFGVAAPVG